MDFIKDFLSGTLMIPIFLVTVTVIILITVGPILLAMNNENFWYLGLYFPIYGFSYAIGNV